MDTPRSPVPITTGCDGDDGLDWGVCELMELCAPWAAAAVAAAGTAAGMAVAVAVLVRMALRSHGCACGERERQSRIERGGDKDTERGK